QSSIKVTLKEDTQTLDEVVVVGYGTMRKSDVTGSIGVAKGDDLTKNESKLLSIQGIAKASAFCLLLSAFSVNAAMAAPAPAGTVASTQLGVETPAVLWSRFAHLEGSILSKSESFV
ncbi:hypothetical protein VPJ68_00345, partial [Parabacteroides distasonis]